MIITEKDVSRFKSYIKKRYGKDKSCWLWTGCIDKAGYGKFMAQNKAIYVQRYAYLAFIKNEIPKDMRITRTCNRKLCVNPKHLVLMHSKDIIKSHAKKPKIDENIKFCGRNHPQTEENTYIATLASGLKKQRCSLCLIINQKVFAKETKMQRMIRNSVIKNDCILYSKSMNDYGYSRILVNKNVIMAHKYVYMRKNKLRRIPKGKIVRHTCNNRNCINIEHLYLAKRTDIVREKVSDV